MTERKLHLQHGHLEAQKQKKIMTQSQAAKWQESDQGIWQSSTARWDTTEMNIENWSGMFNHLRWKSRQKKRNTKQKIQKVSWETNEKKSTEKSSQNDLDKAYGTYLGD